MDSSTRVDEYCSVQAPSGIRLAKPSDNRRGCNVKGNGFNCSEEETVRTRNHHRSPGSNPPQAPIFRSGLQEVTSINLLMEMVLANTDDHFTGWLTSSPSHLFASIVRDVVSVLPDFDIEISPKTHWLYHHADAGIIMSYSPSLGFAPSIVKYPLNQSLRSAQAASHYAMAGHRDLFGVGDQFGC